MKKIMTKNKKPIEQSQKRTFDFSKENINVDERTAELAFSSEDEYERWFGIEVLGHKSGEIRMKRIENSAPLLADHDTRDQIGVVVSAQIDADGTGRAVVRFSKSARGEEIFQDVQDGIRTKVSVGYRIHELKLIEERENIDVYRVTDWEPHEVSIVSVPADDTVGVGRELNLKETKVEENEEVVPSTKKDEVKKIDTEAIAIATRAEEIERIKSINSLGRTHNQDDLAQEYIDNGKSVDEMRTAILEKMDEPKPLGTGGDGFERGQGGEKSFSLVRLLKALANPADATLQKEASYEFEVSANAARSAGIAPKGVYVPHNVMRDMTVGVAANGGNLVGTEHRGDLFIDALKNKSVMLNRANILTGLTGNVQIPRLISSVTAQMLTEVETITGSELGIDQVSLSPKRVGASVDFSKQALLQSSPDLENLILQDIVSEIGLKIDYMSIAGSGAGSEPTGILNTTGIGLVSIGVDGGALTFGHAVDLESEVAVDNADVGDLGYVINARTRGKLKQTEKSANTAQFVIDGKELNGYSFDTSNQIPANLTKGVGTNLSAVLFGNYNDLMIGLWGGLDIVVDPYTLAKDGKIRITADQFFDVAVRRSQSFAVVKDAVVS